MNKEVKIIYLLLAIHKTDENWQLFGTHEDELSAKANLERNIKDDVKYGNKNWTYKIEKHTITTTIKEICIYKEE